jgi:hypothetical protein
MTLKFFDDFLLMVIPTFRMITGYIASIFIIITYHHQNYHHLSFSSMVVTLVLMLLSVDFVFSFVYTGWSSTRMFPIVNLFFRQLPISNDFHIWWQLLQNRFTYMCYSVLNFGMIKIIFITWWWSVQQKDWFFEGFSICKVVVFGDD